MEKVRNLEASPSAEKEGECDLPTGGIGRVLTPDGAEETTASTLNCPSGTCRNSRGPLRPTLHGGVVLPSGFLIRQAEVIQAPIALARQKRPAAQSIRTCRVGRGDRARDGSTQRQETQWFKPPTHPSAFLPLQSKCALTVEGLCTVGLDSRKVPQTFLFFQLTERADSAALASCTPSSAAGS